MSGPIDITLPGIINGSPFLERAQDIDVEIEVNECNTELDLWAIKGIDGSYQEVSVATPSVTGELKGKGADLRDITGG
jgi:hypothetical protein